MLETLISAFLGWQISGFIAGRGKSPKYLAGGILSAIAIGAAAMVFVLSLNPLSQSAGSVGGAALVFGVWSAIRAFRKVTKVSPEVSPETNTYDETELKKRRENAKFKQSV